MVVLEDRPVRCTLVGDAMIGKSTLVQTFINQGIEPNPYVATVLETYQGCIDVSGRKHSVTIFDNAGQHDYESTRLATYRDTEVLAFCYSVADRNSLESISEFWLPEVNNSRRRRQSIILVGTQTDLRTDCDNEFDCNYCVCQEEGEDIAREIGASAFVECSAYHTDTVNKVFQLIATIGLKCKKRRNSIIRKMFGR